MRRPSPRPSSVARMPSATSRRFDVTSIPAMTMCASIKSARTRKGFSGTMSERFSPISARSRARVDGTRFAVIPCGVVTARLKGDYRGGAVTWKHVRLITLMFDIGGAFFSFVIGGWVAARIAGIYRSEPAMVHGAVAWLLAVPMIVAGASTGAVASLGGWYGGPGNAPAVTTAGASAAEAGRNSAMAAVVALLLGLVGAVLGGWMASGEPMTFTYYRRRELARGESDRPRRVA